MQAHTRRNSFRFCVHSRSNEGEMRCVCLFVFRSMCGSDARGTRGFSLAIMMMGCLSLRRKGQRSLVPGSEYGLYCCTTLPLICCDTCSHQYIFYAGKNHAINNSRSRPTWRMDPPTCPLTPLSTIICTSLHGTLSRSLFMIADAVLAGVSFHPSPRKGMSIA